MSKSWHPGLEDLALWVIDPKSDHVTPELREHVSEGCRACEALIRELQSLAAQVPEAIQGLPAEELLRRCRDLHPARAAAESLLLVAELIEDTEQLTGVRGEAADGRHLLFRAGEFDIDLRVRTTGSKTRHEVRGQLHAPRNISPEGVKVRAVRGNLVLTEERTNQHGEFKMFATGAGALRLELVGDRIRIRTPELSV